MRMNNEKKPMESFFFYLNLSKQSIGSEGFYKRELSRKVKKWKKIFDSFFFLKYIILSTLYVLLCCFFSY